VVGVLPVPDLVAGVARVRQDGRDGSQHPPGPAAMQVPHDEI
jgi:hypothetical protein